MLTAIKETVTDALHAHQTATVPSIRVANFDSNGPLDTRSGEMAFHGDLLWCSPTPPAAQAR
jgi:hypothetical protein